VLEIVQVGGEEKVSMPMVVIGSLGLLSCHINVGLLEFYYATKTCGEAMMGPRGAIHCYS
jgi:hypothetical protein